MAQTTTAELEKPLKEAAEGMTVSEGDSILGTVDENGELNERIMITGMTPGEFSYKALMVRRDDPNLGWECEYGVIGEEDADHLNGVIPDSVSVRRGPDADLAEVTVNDIVQGRGDAKQIATYVGPIASLGFMRAD